MSALLNKNRALSTLREAIRRNDLEVVKRLILVALKEDCSDSDVGRAIRLSVMEDTTLPRKNS